MISAEQCTSVLSNKGARSSIWLSHGCYVKNLGKVTTHHNREVEIAMAASHTSTSNQDSGFVSVLPGEKFKLPYNNSDNFGQGAKVFTWLQGTQVRIPRSWWSLHAYYIKQWSSALWTYQWWMLHSSRSQQRLLVFNVTMLPYPLEYTVDSENEQNSSQSICAYGTNNQYTGIVLGN